MRCQWMTDRAAIPAFEQPALFAADTPDAAVTALGPRRRRAAAGAKHGARVRTPRRDQQVWARIDLDAAVAEDDPVRSITRASASVR